MDLGMILMGHGHFASGMYSTLSLIGGEQEAVAWIDFTEDKDMEGLLTELKEQAEQMKECEHLLVLCDLDGGTPYKTALLYAMEHDNVEILSGVNFPLLLECSLMRSTAEDVETLLTMVLTSGKDSMKRFDRSLMQG